MRDTEINYKKADRKKVHEEIEYNREIGKKSKEGRQWGQ